MENRPKTAKKRKNREAEMAGDKFRAIDGIIPTRGHKPVGEDPSRMITELAPGKKGGHFELPFGGFISIPAGVLQKKDVVTCCQVSPSNRYKYLPPLGLHDHLLSEVFLFSISCKFNKKMGIKLKFPYKPENMDICDVVLKIKVIRDDEWRNYDCKFSDSGHFVELDAEGPGIYAVVSTPKVERFDVPVNGVLYNTKLSKQISLRFPKKATDTDMHCDVQILPLNRHNLPALRADYPREMEDLIAASDFYDVKPSVQKEFKRSVTVKLPLPSLDENDENFDQEDMCVMALTPEGWVLLETPLKFTKTSVTFDTKVLTRFCVALALSKRRKRLKETFKHIQRELNVTRGEILPFIHLEEKSWTLWFDCVPNELKEDTINKRIGQGFRRIEQMVLLAEEEQKPIRGRHWKLKQEVKRAPSRTDLDLVPGLVYDLEIGGDLQICEDDNGKFFTGLHYHQRMSENYRKFAVRPRDYMEEGAGSKTLTGILKVFGTLPSPEDGTPQRMTLRTFDVDIEPEIVKAYFYVEPEIDPQPVRRVIIEEPEEEPEPVPVAPPVVKKTMSSDTFLRLITPTKPPKKISKESKVLSGRSLMTLAREVEQGLTLAIHLDLNDSTITGMGFDALAKGQSLVDITYKILMLWKRKSSRHKDKQIDILVNALQNMNRNDVAAILLDKHRQNVELTPDCFSALHSD